MSLPNGYIESLSVLILHVSVNMDATDERLHQFAKVSFPLNRINQAFMRT